MPICKPRPHHRPPWWPEEEPWPPSGPPSGRNMYRVRGQFVRRMGCLAALVLLFLVAISSVLTWVAARAVAIGYHLPWALIAIGLILFFLGGMSFTFRSFRKTIQPIRDLLDGVSRVTGGDYTHRVPEDGSRDARALAKAFNEMVERLQINEQQRRDLLADVTHELRTPITIIQGNLEGMLDGIYPADSDHLQSLLEETRVLSRVIEDLRTLSLAEGGALKLQLQSTDIEELVRETVEAFEATAASSQVRLCIEVAPNLPLVEADPTRIREVLANLVANALRYTPAGGEIRLAGRVDGADEMRIAISDTGKGIPAEDLPHIFDRFYKGHDSHGTGLGLAIVKSLVEAHQGEVHASSRPGEGTTIEFSLPLAP